GEGIDVAQVDAHQLGRVAGGADRQDGGPDPGAVEDRPEDAGEQQRHGQAAEADVGNRDAAQVEAVAGVGRRHRAKVGGKDEQDEADDDQIDPEGQQKREEQGRPNHTIDHASLEGVAQHEQREGVDRQTEERVDVQPVEQEPGDVGADGHQRPVRQLDDIENAPAQAQAERDRHIDAAQQNAEAAPL